MFRHGKPIPEKQPATRRSDEEAIRFQQGKRGRIAPSQPISRGKIRITIRLDEDLLDHFLKLADASGGKAGYQTLINDALRRVVEGTAPKFEDTLRRIVREELRATG
ncbi:MAG TPA: BrnA antitoxin family protein [Acidobacteriaceae bacterium]|nr:BrnA antitoxin family protein [Acidobacteriaceae bacterium]